MMERIDISPTPHVLHAMRNQNLGWTKALGELIDNAFDASAMRVVVTARNKTVTIEDDGRGMVDVSSAVRIGDHRSQNGLGMYGIGLKDAWLYADGALTVETVHGEVRSRLHADIQDMLARQQWSIDAPTQESASGSASGTRVDLTLGFRRKLPQSSCLRDLSWMFTPGLLQGKQIVWRSGNQKPKTLAATQLPSFIEEVIDDFDVNGRSVRIRIGIVRDGERMLNGPFWVQYKHRNIMKSHIGVGSFSDERMGGVIELGDGWSLTKNKDDFDENKDDLSEAIHDRIKLILQKCEQLTEDIESRQLMLELEQTINDAIGSVRREKRDPIGTNSGTVFPGNSGRKRKRAAKSTNQTGSVSEDAGTRRRGLTLGFNYLDSEVIGEYDNSSRRITLNAAHAFIKAMRAEKNKPALHSLAMSVFSNYACNHDGTNLTLFEVRDFTQTLGVILGSMEVSSHAANTAVR